MPRQVSETTLPHNKPANTRTTTLLTSAVSKSVKRDMKTKDGYFHSLKYTGKHAYPA